MPPGFPCIYELEPIGVDGALEAVCAHYYCSDTCRNAEVETFPAIRCSEADLSIDGIVCEHCSKSLRS